MTEKSGAAYRKLLAELSNVLSDRTHTASNDSIALRDAVCAYVANEHLRGTPLHGVIATVKEILRNAENGAARATDELAQQLIDWCTEFHPGASGIVPSAPPVS